MSTTTCDYLDRNISETRFLRILASSFFRSCFFFLFQEPRPISTLSPILLEYCKSEAFYQYLRYNVRPAQLTKRFIKDHSRRLDRTKNETHDPAYPQHSQKLGLILKRWVCQPHEVSPLTLPNNSAFSYSPDISALTVSAVMSAWLGFCPLHQPERNLIFSRIPKSNPWSRLLSLDRKILCNKSVAEEKKI